MPDVWEVKGVSVNNFKDMSRGELNALQERRDNLLAIGSDGDE